ncbi:hypothetical protein VTN00DRAFT_8765 [Thermoascus crustaceus]|uniref:uncharacterized protein n=1 Tax=Thermoascus crustaceus TaxID=5088 RepID=UPI0037433830
MAGFMSSLSAICFGLSCVLAGYLCSLCFTPPNPNPQQIYRGDRIRMFAMLPTFIFNRFKVRVLALYHALLSLAFAAARHSGGSGSNILESNASRFCPNPSNLNPDLFSWNPLTAGSLAAILLVGAPLRLAAFGGLGKNFTFKIAPPDRLITTGIYRYVQHPGYTGLIVAAAGSVTLFFRWDASFACWIPGHVLDKLNGFEWTWICGLVGFAVSIFALRVRDEERMLKEKFGDEWKRWHRETSRFIPGII